MIREFLRWLFTGKSPKRLCEVCARGNHIHNMYSGKCITPNCECEMDD